jgi:hypothetical protein
MVGNMFGNPFETPSWMQELLWRIQMDQQNADSGIMGQNGSRGQNAERGQQPQAPKLLPEGHPYRRFMKNPLAGLEGDPMAGKEDGIVPEGHPYRKFMKNPNQEIGMMTAQTPQKKLLPEGHPYRKFMKDPMAGLPLKEMMTLSGSESGLQAPQKGNRAQQIQEIKAMTGLNEEEKNRALGMMLVKLFSGLAQPGHGDGVGGALSALAQNMGGAVDAYAGEEGRVQDLNTRLYGHMDNKEMEQQKAWQSMLEKLQDQLHKKEQFDETKRHNLRTEENTAASATENRRYHDLRLKEQEGKREEGKTQKAITRLEKQLEGEVYGSAEAEATALKEAQDLLENPEALRGWITSLTGKPEAFKNDKEMDLEALGTQIRGHQAKRFKYNTKSQQESLPSLNPSLGKEENKALVNRYLKGLEPVLQDKRKKEALLRSLQTGENPQDILQQQQVEQIQQRINTLKQKIARKKGQKA